MKCADGYQEDMSGDEGDIDYLDRHVADEDANPLGRLQDQRMRVALVEAIKNLPEREQSRRACVNKRVDTAAVIGCPTDS